MRACSSAESNGLLRKSSAPASMPFNLSCLSDCDVTMTTGMNRVEMFSLLRRQISNPCPSGATRSIRTRSGGFAEQADSTPSPVGTIETLCPSRVSSRFRNSELVASSSAIRIDAGACTIGSVMQYKGRGAFASSGNLMSAGGLEERSDAPTTYGACRGPGRNDLLPGLNRALDQSDKSDTLGRNDTERNSRRPRQGYPAGVMGQSRMRDRRASLEEGGIRVRRRIRQWFDELSS